LMWGSCCWEYKLWDGNSGSGPVGGGEGGGSSSKKRGRGLGTMNSEDDTTENSDSEGEGRRRNGAGEGVTRERATGERKGIESKDGGALRRMEGMGEADVDGGFELKVGSMIFGRGGRFSEATETSEGDGGMVNVLSDGLKRVEGVKRTPYGRGAADKCSFEEPGDRVRLSVSRDLARGGSYDVASQDCIGSENGLIS
jgi:hypothetical protein